MNLVDIEVICELPNFKNFSDAAYSLSYSPSVITKYVNRVEKELGVKLFVRSRKSSEQTLTPEGRILINSMRRVNDSYQYMLSLAEQIKNVNENTLRIGSQARLGNIQEQELIARYLADKLDTEIDIVKANAKDLTMLLTAGKIDGMFLTVHHDLNIEEFLSEDIDASEVDIAYLGYDNHMFFGISEKYLPGKLSAPFREFRDFIFALPFRPSQDVSDVKAISTFETMANENKFQLQTMFVRNHDDSIFRLATMKKIAISSTNNVTLYNGIKFVQVEDWSGGTKRYFISMKNNCKKTLQELRHHVNRLVQEDERKTAAADRHTSVKTEK